MTKHLFVNERYRQHWDLPDSDWPAPNGGHQVFIQRFDLPEQPASLPESFHPLAGIRLYLFGRRVPEIGSDIFRVNYTAIETRAGASSVTYHDLHQSFSKDGDSCFYSTDDEHARYHAHNPKVQPGRALGQDFKFGCDLGNVTYKQLKVFVQNEAYISRLHNACSDAGRPKNTRKWLGERVQSDFQHLGRMPRWVEGEGDWPFVESYPMLFVAQTILRTNATTQEHLTFDTMLYLFVGLRDCRLVCKLYEQSVNTQTAEAHYRLEELLAVYHVRPRDSDVVHKVVTKGDRFVHQYLLEKQDLPTATLALLARHAANKELRSIAAKRLREIEPK